MPEKKPWYKHTVAQVLLWIFVPYVMVFFYWKKTNSPVLKSLMVGWAVIALFIGMGHQKPDLQQAKQDAQQAKADAEAEAMAKAQAEADAKKADAEAKAEAEAQAKAQAKAKTDEESVSPDYVKGVIVDKFGSKTTTGKPTIVKIESNDDLGEGVKKGQKILFLTLNSDDPGLTNPKEDLWLHTKDAMRLLFKNPKVEEVNLDWQAPLVDTYGKTTDDVVMQVKFTRKEASQINWDNFDFKNVPVIAKSSGYYWEHPVLNK